MQLSWYNDKLYFSIIFDRVFRSLQNQEDYVGRIRIGIIESIVHTWLGNFLTGIKQAYPKLEIELTAEPTSHLHALFAKGALDVILQTDPVLVESVVNSELPSLELGTFRIGAMESTAASRPPEILSRYHALCPGVKVHLETDTAGGLTRRLTANEIDVAFLAEPL